MLTISTEDFNRLVKFMKGTYGIDLTKKRQLITGRLSLSLIHIYAVSSISQTKPKLHCENSYSKKMSAAGSLL